MKGGAHYFADEPDPIFRMLDTPRLLKWGIDLERRATEVGLRATVRGDSLARALQEALGIKPQDGTL